MKMLLQSMTEGLKKVFEGLCIEIFRLRAIDIGFKCLSPVVEDLSST